MWLKYMLLSLILLPNFSLIATIKIKLYRIRMNTDKNIEDFANFTRTYDNQLDVWRFPTTINKPADFLITQPESTSKIEEILQNMNLSYSALIDDIAVFMANVERKDSQFHAIIGGTLLNDDRMSKQSRNATPSFDIANFHGYDEITQFMKDLQKLNPNIISTRIIGYTHEKRPLYVIKIGRPIENDGRRITKPGIWIDAGIHAREWLSVTTATYLIHTLASGYGKDDQITKYVDNLDWYILPVTNPDGYEYTRSSKDPLVRLWRKNRSLNREKCRLRRNCCMGVDLNRNFDFHWSESGSSKNPCASDYHGSRAFSEPESKAIDQFLTNFDPIGSIKSFISLHSYSQLWFHSFNHKRGRYPKDLTDLKQVADQAVKNIASAYGMQYRTGTCADLLYPASGSSQDWAKSTAGIKYSYSIELRPNENAYGGFIVGRDQIVPAGRELWEGIKAVADVLIDKS